jgi:diacylglycerol O-acyltransferase / wax synthase
VANPDRLSGLDASFLHLENDVAHMHVAACAVFDGSAPGYEELLAAVSARLPLVPRYRQRLAFVPLAQGRPVWVDDPHFNLSYHIRHTALPRPGGDLELRRLAGRVISQALDRARPLWELWLIEGLRGDRFALLFKNHHALVDGVSGVDIASVLFDSHRERAEVAQDGQQWVARPLPSPAQLLASALLERTMTPAILAHGACGAARLPARLARRIAVTLVGLESLTSASMRPAPPTPLNVTIGPHRRVAWTMADLARMRAVGRAERCTVNDVILSIVAAAVGHYLRGREADTDELSLRVMVPVSTRSEHERGRLGNRLSAVFLSLPVEPLEPLARLRAVRAATESIKRSGQAVSARVLIDLTGFAPTTLLAQAARLKAHQRLFNLVVTNVPGPQRPLYLLGRELEIVHPLVPLAQNTALGVAIMSYDGRISFGLTADFDALADLDGLADAFRLAIAELLEAVDPESSEPGGQAPLAAAPLRAAERSERRSAH